MRISRLAISLDGEDIRMPFHPRVTVMSGLAEEDRAAVGGLIVGAVAGDSSDRSTLDWTDTTGESRKTINDGNGGVTGGPTFLGTLASTGNGLRHACVIGPSDLGAPRFGTEWTRPELTAARADLADVNAAVMAARDRGVTIDSLRRELADIEDELRSVTEGAAKRRYAKLLLRIQQVQSELSALAGGKHSAEADQRLVDAGYPIHQAATQWRAAKDAVAAEDERFGLRGRLDPRTLAEGLASPAETPAGLDELVEEWEQASRAVTEVERRITDLRTANLPEPSHPAVVKLSMIDQDQLWDCANAAVDAGWRIEQASLALGGLDAGGVTAAVADEIEHAHKLVEEAEAAMAARRLTGLFSATTCLAIAVALPLVLGAIGAMVSPALLLAGAAVTGWAILLPRINARKARGLEDDALVKAGVSNYLAFQLRRIDVAIDPTAREPLEVAVLQRRAALGKWGELCPELTPEDAFHLEEQVRAYAAALAVEAGAAAEIEALQRQLVSELRPIERKAREALLETARPFGFGDDGDSPACVAELIRRQAATAVTARLQKRLEDAEAERDFAANVLRNRLAEHGFVEEEEPVFDSEHHWDLPPDSLGGPDLRLDACLGGYEWAAEAARQRVAARLASRPVGLIEAELAELEERARTEGRPEWHNGAVTVADAVDPDVEDLLRRREKVEAVLADVAGAQVDLAALQDRRSALSRRVHSLEEEEEERRRAAGNPDLDLENVKGRLLARAAGARRPAGGGDETLPLILDDPFAHVTGDAKWDLLDLVERISQDVQVIYLTSDTDVVVWARRRRLADTVSLLEPAPEYS